MNQKKLLELRDKIDSVDDEIQKLISERALLAKKIAKVKTKQKDNTIFYRPEREAQVLNRVRKNNTGVISDDTMAMLFHEIMSACLALEQILQIAYLGPEGTFSQSAVIKHFGHSVNCLNCNTIADVFNQVTKNNANYGVVPVENSSNGVIAATLDMLYTQNLKVCGEVEVAVNHQLIANNSKDDIKIIYGHQQSLEQCRYYLASNYPNAELMSAKSNASAAKMVKNIKNSAAIASNYALEYYKLTKIANNIEDVSGNSTRFLILGKEDILPSNNDKTSLLVISKHQSGALFDILKPFKTRDINILQLARHPLSNIKWEYLFFIDIVGHKNDSNVKEALNEVKTKAMKLVILGSYPINIF